MLKSFFWKKKCSEQQEEYGKFKKEWHRDQAFGSETFAQHGEDLMILSIFDCLGIKKGIYWDIGAHHPYVISNTALLYERGWRGVNVEANPNLIKNFDMWRPDDINLCVGIAGEEGTLPFYMIDDWSAINSFNKEEIEKFVKQNPLFSIREVKKIPVHTINWLFHFVGEKTPDLISLDVENMEYDILKKCDFSDIHPKLIIIENPRKELKQVMKDAGYFLYCVMTNNFFFIANEYRDTIYRLNE